MDTASLFRHIVEAIFNPFSILLEVFGFLIIWLFLRGDGQLVRVGLLIVFIGLIVMSSGWFSQAIANRLEHQYSVVDKVDPNIHWVVVFGGGQQRHVKAPVNQLLNSESKQRLIEGVRLYRELPDAKLIVSAGGEIDPSESEAAHMATMATWFSIPSRNLILETTSINTADEAVAINQWVKKEPFYLVTSAIHMPRSMALCRKQGLNPVAAPSDYPYDQSSEWLHRVAPHPGYLLKLSYAWHEMLGRVWAVARGKI